MQPFHGQAREIEKQNAEQQIIQFNTQFTIYQDREDLTIYDVLTVVNLAIENNLKNEGNNENQITVNITGKAIIANCERNREKVEELVGTDRDSIREDAEGIHGLPTYKCIISEYNNEGRVKKINFEKLSS